jgi:hypothetical protein
MANADTIVDPEPEHTAVRAALVGWLTPAYARAQLHASVVDDPVADWTSWTRHRAYIVATARLSGDDHPPDTPTVAARMVLITQQAVGRDGWRGRPTSGAVAVVLMRINRAWRIDSDQPS